jgi:hypothetical protein
MTKEEVKEYQQEYYKKNKEKYKLEYQNNKEKINERNKIYYHTNKEIVLKKQKKYQKNNKEKINNQSNIYAYNRKKTDPLFKLKCNLRIRICNAIKNKNYIKSKSTLEMLGCDLHTVKAHLEKQFTKGMTWANHGEWHIDHIIPYASAKTEDELIKLFHYTNLQPLWAADNIIKSDKIIEKQLFLI